LDYKDESEKQHGQNNHLIQKAGHKKARLIPHLHFFMESAQQFTAFTTVSVATITIVLMNNIPFAMSRASLVTSQATAFIIMFAEILLHMGRHPKCRNQKKTSIPFAFSDMAFSACLCQLIPVNSRIASLFFQDFMRSMAIITFGPMQDTRLPSMAIELVMTLIAVNSHRPFFRLMIFVKDIVVAVPAGDPISAVNRGAIGIKGNGEPALVASCAMTRPAFLIAIGPGIRKGPTE
jgi:hypothetical protein